MVGTDMDLRPVHEYVDLTKYDVIVCQNCGYASLSRYHGTITDRQKKAILEKISQNYKGDMTPKKVYTYEEALAHYQLALVNAIVRQAKHSEKAYICLKAGWLVRGYAEWLLTEEGKKDAEAEKKLVEALKSMLGIAAKVKLVAPKSITRSEGKAVRVVDKRKI